jgi:hypothetical protein
MCQHDAYARTWCGNGLAVCRLGAAAHKGHVCRTY